MRFIQQVLLLCLCTIPSISYALSVEPANWWVGMKKNTITLMLHEQNIANTQFKLLPYQGVELTNTTRTENPNYVFLHVTISDTAQAGTLKFNSSDNNNFNFSLLERTKNSAEREGFSSKDTVYLINPDRFVNGDKQNDTVSGMLEKVNPTFKGGRHGGDIQGVINALPYLKDLGITQLWLTPVLENNMPDYSYHGYAITDFYNVDPRMGSNSLYKSLSIKAKDQGIGLVMDMVLNHFGAEHKWMKDKPSKDWINFNGEFKNGKNATSHARQTIQDPHASEYDKRQFSDGWFVASMPDLNQRQPLLSEYLIQNALWWIEYADLSGIRVDTYSYSDKAFLTAWTKAIMDEYPHFNIVGEEWTSNPAIASYWQRKKVNQDGYTSSLPSVMDFSLQEALIQALNEEESWSTGWVKVYQSLANDFLYPDTDNIMVFADNHDMSRVYTELKQDLAKTKMAMTMLLTTRGIPQIYYGTEVLLDNTPSKDHGDIRIDFPGGFEHQQANAFTGEDLTADQHSMHTMMSALLHFRKTSPALTNGKLTHFSPKNGVYSYARLSDEQTVLVFLNKNAQTINQELDYMKEVLPHNAKAKDILSNETHMLKSKLTLKPMSATVLVINK
ncbi:glycoside hydrolase family 13 protein [Pseudoalteromonas sp. SG45-5]|uniref:glycoside hydrolase family 13 protein n=1 Tax=unclassified Pseudoalteromonas TaxID=194690 RepID=UPI0015FD969D|nr:MULTISPECIES: glycoside hydrolase family 13 protein [unclassified Pseudoalteromonas]MBB1386757.1 glycoside hydrolase family 13 protein [Pseudoalteromonas sp. SG45-5]MBB1394813.1 glycoside hydrolase family 13 protein [Pseudoalteromonas sp. SG44-4]MBB1446702.1 glycoside hydrolase family 13 protein [Pseudoalteromonas sp. SG41-6]